MRSWIKILKLLSVAKNQANVRRTLCSLFGLAGSINKKVEVGGGWSREGGRDFLAQLRKLQFCDGLAVNRAQYCPDIGGNSQ